MWVCVSALLSLKGDADFPAGFELRQFHSGHVAELLRCVEHEILLLLLPFVRAVGRQVAYFGLKERETARE